MAAPALIPVGSEVRWADTPVLHFEVQSRESLASFAPRALQDANEIGMLAETNKISAEARLCAGQTIDVPGAMLKRELLPAVVTSFSGVATL